MANTQAQNRKAVSAIMRIVPNKKKELAAYLEYMAKNAARDPIEKHSLLSASHVVEKVVPIEMAQLPTDGKRLDLNKIGWWVKDRHAPMDCAANGGIKGAGMYASILFDAHYILAEIGSLRSKQRRAG